MQSAYKPSSKCVEIIKDKLYWVSDKKPPKEHAEDFFFNVDNQLVYNPINNDFGPLDLGKTYRFVTELQELLNNPSYSNVKLFHHTSLDDAKRTNTACLMGCFQILVLGRTAEEAWEPFSKVQPSFIGFRDTSSLKTSLEISILDVLKGLEYAVKLKWFDLKNFNFKDYEFYAQRENGNLHWIVPGRFAAFSGPVNKPKTFGVYKSKTPEDYVPLFKENGVNLVIRLNNKEYDTDKFTSHGIKHRDFYFLDGSCPKEILVQRFIDECEKEKGAIAVHCKAGLGRTGTMIACYIMKHYKFPAAALVGWIRLARPGSVLGSQLQFLIDKEKSFHQSSNSSPIFQSISSFVQDLWEHKDSSPSQSMDSLEISVDHDTIPQELITPKFGDSQVDKFSEIKASRRA